MPRSRCARQEANKHATGPYDTCTAALVERRPAQRIADSVGVFSGVLAGATGGDAIWRAHFARRCPRQSMARLRFYWRCRQCQRCHHAPVAGKVFLATLAQAITGPGRAVAAQSTGLVAAAASERQLVAVATGARCNCLAGRSPGGFGSTAQYAATQWRHVAWLGQF